MAKPGALWDGAAMLQRKSATVAHAAGLLTEALRLLDSAELGGTAAPHIALAIDHLTAEGRSLQALSAAVQTLPSGRTASGPGHRA